MQPVSAEATPAACGKGATAPAWPQGWCMPWPKVYRPCASSTAASGGALMKPHAAMPSPPAMLKNAPRRTVPAMPSCGSQRRQTKVPSR